MTSVETYQLLAALELGMIDPDDAIAWADRRIVEADDIPYWIIELSTSTRASRFDLADILRKQVSEQKSTDREFLGAMAVRLFDLNHSLYGILPMMYERFCLTSRPVAKDVGGMIFTIDDELDWDLDRATVTARDFLQPYLEIGRDLLQSTKR
jgi:hypothetical protein